MCVKTRCFPKRAPLLKIIQKVFIVYVFIFVDNRLLLMQFDIFTDSFRSGRRPLRPGRWTPIQIAQERGRIGVTNRSQVRALIAINFRISCFRKRTGSPRIRIKL